LGFHYRYKEHYNEQPKIDLQTKNAQNIF